MFKVLVPLFGFLFAIAVMVRSSYELDPYEILSVARRSEESVEAYSLLVRSTLPLFAVLLAVFYTTLGPQTLRIPWGLVFLFLVIAALLLWSSFSSLDTAFDLFFVVLANVFLGALLLFYLKNNPLSRDRSQAVLVAGLVLGFLAALAVALVNYLDAAPSWLVSISKAMVLANVSIVILLLMDGAQGVDALATGLVLFAAMPLVR